VTQIVEAAVVADDFDSWVRPHLLAMTRLACRLAGDAAADDVIQEALTRAWRRRSTYDASKGEALPWLLAITADRARRHRTRTKVTHELLDGPAPHVDADGRVDVLAAVARLPRKQRLAVELHYFLGLDTAVTAQALGCAVGTVKSQLSDARARLRLDLGDAR
jgi:RNA polymerase sigma-70 factor (ECF subfamily)